MLLEAPGRSIIALGHWGGGLVQRPTRALQGPGRMNTALRWQPYVTASDMDSEVFCMHLERPIPGRFIIVLMNADLIFNPQLA